MSEDIKDGAEKRTKNRGLYIRVSKEEIEMLKYVSERTGKSASDIMRDGLKMTYNLEKYRE